MIYPRTQLLFLVKLALEMCFHDLLPCTLTIATVGPMAQGERGVAYLYFKAYNLRVSVRKVKGYDACD